MTEQRNKGLYGPEYIPDPVTADAVAAAVAATDPKKTKSSFFNKLITIGLVFLVVIAMSASVVTAINSVQNVQQNITLKNQNIALENEQACLVKVIENQQKDSNARVQIAADDREVVDDLIQAVFNAKTPAEGQKALAAYNKRREENETRRKKLPVTELNCNLKK